MLWGSNVPQTRTPDAHFYDRGALSRRQGRGGQPDYSEATKFADLWLNPKQGTDAALAMAMGHVILREFHLDRQVPSISRTIAAVLRHADAGPAGRTGRRLVPERLLRASDFAGDLGEANNPEWKTVAIDEARGEVVAPSGSIGLPLGRAGQVEPEEKDGQGSEVKLR
jgi:nitrate reductase alpha subunit